MPKNMRDLIRLDSMRRSVRDKAMRAIDQVVGKYHHEQAEQLQRLEREIGSLREQLAAQSEQFRQEGQRTVDRVVEFEIRSHRDIVFQGAREAALESSQFVRKNMASAQHFGRPHQTLEYALSLAPTGGMALEFGVYTGSTLKIISAARDASQVYGFDSFEGLPSDWRAGYPAGAFTVDGLPDVAGAELVVGWFDDTVPGFLAEHDGVVDFLHVDGDLYSSAKTVLDLVGPRLRPGSIIVFDEFFNFPDWQQHEYKAWLEYVEQTGIQFTYEAYTYDNEQVVVRVTAT